MHELSVCLALIEQVEKIARHHNASQVTEIVVRLGPLSGVEPDLLRHAYPLAAVSSLAEHAALVIEAADVVVRCSQCGEESRATANRLLCGACNDYRTRIVSGDEMILQRIELAPAATEKREASMQDRAARTL